MDFGSRAAVGGWSAAHLNFQQPEGILRCDFLLVIPYAASFIYFPAFPAEFRILIFLDRNIFITEFLLSVYVNITTFYRITSFNVLYLPLRLTLSFLN